VQEAAAKEAAQASRTIAMKDVTLDAAIEASAAVCLIVPPVFRVV
jgi:hypothetical protein